MTLKTELKNIPVSEAVDVGFFGLVFAVLPSIDHGRFAKFDTPFKLFSHPLPTPSNKRLWLFNTLVSVIIIGGAGTGLFDFVLAVLPSIDHGRFAKFDTPFKLFSHPAQTPSNK